MNYLPKARLENTVLQKVGQETLVYCLSTNQAFCLNETSAKVWNSCDGNKTIDEISKAEKLPEVLVLLSIEKLEKQNLLESGVPPEILQTKLSRRRIISAAAAMSIMLPVVTALLVPTAASAQSIACIPNGGIFQLPPQPDLETCFENLGIAENDGTGCCEKSQGFFFGEPRNFDCIARCPTSAPRIIVTPPNFGGR